MRKFLLIVVAGVAIAAPLSTNAATVSGVKWAGAWKTTCWYKMDLTQKGTQVKGTFTLYAGQLTGTAIGKKLSGKWSQPYVHYSGTYVFTMGSTGKAFTGLVKQKGHKTKACSGKKIRR